MRLATGIELRKDRAFIAIVNKKGNSLSLENFFNIYFSDTDELRLELKKCMPPAAKHNVAISVPVHNTILRKFSVAFTDKQQIDQIIHYETENYIHSQEIEELIVDYTILQKNREKTKLSVAAVPIATIRKQLQVIDACNIHPFIVDIDLFGLYYFFQTTNRQQKNNILVHANEYHCNFLVMKEGKVHDARKLTMSNTWSDDEDSMGITTEIAIDDIDKHALQSIDMPKYIQRLYRELKKTFLTMNSVDSIYFCGEKQICNELLPPLSSKLKINCKLWQMENDINVNTQGETCNAFVATGLALRAMQQVKGFNFRKGPFAYQNALSILRAPFAILLSLVTLLLIVINIYFFQQVNLKRTSYENVQLNALRIYKRNFASRLNSTYWGKIDEIKRKMQSEITGPEHPMPHDMVMVWSQISEVLDSIRKRYYVVVDQVVMNQNEITFYGRTNDDVGLDLLKLNLRNKPWIDPRDDSLQVVESEIIREPKEPQLVHRYQYFIRMKRSKKSTR